MPSDRGFRLEIAGSLGGRVGVRVIAKPGGWQGPSASIQITGNLSPEDAIAFADDLRAKAEAVVARNAKEEAAEQRRRDRHAKLPTIGFR